MKRLSITLLCVMFACVAMALERSTTIAYINGTKYYIHTVQSGETLSALSRTYGVATGIIVESNPSLKEGLKADAVIRIPVIAKPQEKVSEKKLRKSFDFHEVAKGETLYSISRLYEIPIPTILEDNPDLDPTRLSLGERILIRKKQIGKENEEGSREDWEAYRQRLNSVADAGFAYHIVQKGETFYSLSRRYGCTEDQLSEFNNGLKPGDLKAGAMLKVPAAEQSAEIIEADTVVVAEPEPLEVKDVEFRALRPSQRLKVALMLPLSSGRNAAVNYTEFYQGFLLGLDSVKRLGYSVDLTLYDTGRDSLKVSQIVAAPEFSGTNLVIGPVYEEEVAPVVAYAEEHAVPVVSPLANFTQTSSDVIFQLAPDPLHRYDKMVGMFDGTRQITLIYGSSTDADFEREIFSLVGDTPYVRYDYQFAHHSEKDEEEVNPGDLTPLLDNGKENLFVVMTDNEVEVDRILAALASADSSITSRGRTAPRFMVVGNPRWNRHSNLDRGMLFKDRVTFISSYHARRDSERITGFDSDYIRSFGSLPSLYAYRGYDSAMIFCPAMFGDIEYDMEDRRYTPLQTSYIFHFDKESHNHLNTDWTRVNYNKDFTITLQ